MFVHKYSETENGFHVSRFQRMNWWRCTLNIGR